MPGRSIEMHRAKRELVGRRICRSCLADDYRARLLLSLKHDASNNPSMGGFFVPPQALVDTDLHKAAEIFVSPDGHTVRYLIQTSLNPFGIPAMDQVNEITKVGRHAQPNTELADASISMAGFPAVNRDLRDYYDHDLHLIIVATLIVVFLILVVLLRAIVAPLHLIVSVVISYLSALGVGVIAFQFIGVQQLSWSVSGMAFIVLVAVGADYNMLLISRVRDESPHSVTEGVIKTVATTGGVITSAGLIFAASMFGLLFGSIASMTQAGFIIGVGLLIDTFLVRTVTVPALAVLIGRANWWPTLWGRRAIRLGDVPSPQTEPFSMVDEICTALAGGESPHLIAHRLEVSLSSVAHIENVARSREESSENGPRIPAGK
jgi:putative drug exporter of the RND superfamily